MPSANVDNLLNFVQTSNITDKEENTFIPIKKTSIINREHVLRWMLVEVGRMDSIESSNYAIIAKFSQIWPSIDALRRIIPCMWNKERMSS